MSTHTTGPWLIDRSTATVMVRTSDGGSVARCYKGIADSLLVSAAPDLLKALQLAVADVEARVALGLDAPGWYREAATALQKATGGVA